MAIINVNSTLSLTSALKAAIAGDVIQLAAGTYDGLYLSKMSFGAGVTITSADPSNPAVLTDFALSKVTGLTFSNIEMQTLDRPDYVAAGTSYWAFRVSDSSDIHFDQVKVHGSLDGNAANDVHGLQIRNSQNVSVTDSEFEQLQRAMAIGQTKGVKVLNNDVHDLRSDGFDFAEVGNVEVVGNTFRNFNPVGSDHPDAIQFWTTGTKTASHDILIANNVITKGEGAYTQGIFVTDQLGNLPYERLTIANNLIVGTGYNGIRVVGAKDLTLTNNELITFAGDNKTWVLINKADGVVASGNSATSISFDGSTNVTQVGNTVTTPVSDQGAAALEHWSTAHANVGGSDLVATLQAAVDFAKSAALAQDAALKLIQAAIVDDVVIGDAKANLLEGYGGNDTLDGRGGPDTLVGGAGDDVYIVPNNQAQIVEKAGEGVDTVIARGEHALADNVENLIVSTVDDRGWKATGNSLDNVITGNAGGNLIDGLTGNDTIDGGAGNDTLTGGLGSDWLTGGAGADIFRFAPGSGKDVITDFGAGPDRDTLDISAFIKAGLAPTVVEFEGHAVINFANGDSISLLGVHAADIGPSSKIGWVF